MNCLIVGNGDYARMMARYLNASKDTDILCFTVNESLISSRLIDGIPVLSAQEIHEIYKPCDYRLIMGIGYRNMNQIKAREFRRYKDMGYTFENYIHPTAIIGNDVILGEGNNIFEGVIVQQGVKIGDANLIYGGSIISHESEIGNFNSFSVKTCVAGCTKIGNNCFIGANSTIRDHIAISDYTLVGAAAYVSEGTNPYDVIVPEKSSVLIGKNSLDFI